jgi:hypothetical protein
MQCRGGTAYGKVQRSHSLMLNGSKAPIMIVAVDFSDVSFFNPDKSLKRATDPIERMLAL